MPLNLSSLLLPITTPFTSIEEIDFNGLTSNLEKWNDCSITGYVALGSTGERINLDQDEYLQVVESARRVVPEKITFLVGAGQQRTHGTIAEIDRTGRDRADAGLVI